MFLFINKKYNNEAESTIWVILYKSDYLYFVG